MGLRDAWHRLTWSQDRLEAAELLGRVEQSGDEAATPIGQCPIGETVTVAGVVNSVSLRPQATTPALEIDLYDGSGHVHVVWLGRRMIPGVVAGRSMVVCGRMTKITDQHTIFNPKYRLLPLAG